MIAEREDVKLREKERVGLRVGRIPAHPWSQGCCKTKRTEHLTAERIARLLSVLTSEAER